MLQLSPGKKLTTLYISNHLINAKYNYSLIQERIFNYVIFHCQEYINKVKNGTPIYQLDLFNDDSSSTVQIKIALKHIAPPDEYDHVRESMQKMCSILLQTQVTDKHGKSWQQWQGLFLKVNIPAETKRSAFMIATMDIAIAQMIVSMQRRQDGTPINYTTFMYEVAMNTKNKYTPRIYKLISSWKNKTGFYYSVEELREFLQLGDKYKDMEALRRRILIPVWQELKENADCWFNLTETNFEVKEGKRVVGFNFKVISAKSNLYYVKQMEYLIYTFKTQYHFKNEQIDQIRHIIEDTNLWSSLDWRMNKVNQKLQEDKNITDPAAYTLKCILNHFKGG
jgi:hypothetical protein